MSAPTLNVTVANTTEPSPKPAAKVWLTQQQADRWLKVAVQFWFATALVGQWIFTYYIVAAYWLPVARGESERWNNLLTDFNLAFMMHVGFAIIIFVGGPLQLIPYIRNRFRRFHRWNGRVYLLTVAVATAAGLYMIWTHGTVGGLGVQVGTSISALLVAYFGWQAVRFAIARDFASHRRYALRLFISAIAVWFYRIQLMVWLMLSGGRGLNPETFEGPALVITSFTQYLIPLAILEIYFYVQRAGNARHKVMFSAALAFITLLMAAGIYAASMGLWLARI